MTSGSRFDGRVAILAIALLAVAPLAFGGCGSSGGGDDDPGPQPLAVAASPAGGNYSGVQNVELAATGDGSGGATIYWTDDLSDPRVDTNAGRQEYVSAIAVGDDTVLKFFAMPTTGDPTEVVLEGYTFESSIGADWAESGHGDIAAEAWRHWDFDDPPLVQNQGDPECSICHAENGFRDWAEDGTIDAAAAPSMGLGCDGCHNEDIPNTYYDSATEGDHLDLVAFPSEETVTLAGQSNLCLVCHQGRASGDDVENPDANAVIQDQPDDYDSYSFINIHYYAAAASYFGNEVRGGYEYGSGKNYVARNTFPSHPDSLSTCTGCHMREGDRDHTWFADLDRCLDCHEGNSFATLSGSPAANYQGIQTALTQLLDEIEDYAANTLNYPILYDDHAYPYFFNDNGQGANYGNKYDHFDITLLRAAYNFQFGAKEPCGYIHNGTYMRQLLFDSIDSLGATPMDKPSDRTGYDDSGLSTFIKRTNEFHQSGHDNAAGEAFRHFDEGAPPQLVAAYPGSNCSKCHGSPGFADWALDGALGEPYPPVSVVGCIACHESGDLYSDTDTRYQSGLNSAMDPVPFPSGDTATLNNSSNVCMGCHQGNASGVDVQAEIDASDVHEFINIHYYAAAASFFGADVNGGYQWPAKLYAGPVNWPGSHDTDGFNTCIGCHMVDGTHTFEVELESCAPCHGSPPAGFKEQFGGSGDVDESYTTIETMTTRLYEAIQFYATNTILTDIRYDDHEYPYFFKDSGMDAGDAYDLFDDLLLGAAYNYQFSKKEPCGYMHNAPYMMQILYDSIEAIGGDLTGLSRP